MDAARLEELGEEGRPPCVDAEEVAVTAHLAGELSTEEATETHRRVRGERIRVREADGGFASSVRRGCDWAWVAGPRHVRAEAVDQTRRRSDREASATRLAQAATGPEWLRRRERPARSSPRTGRPSNRSRREARRRGRAPVPRRPGGPRQRPTRRRRSRASAGAQYSSLTPNKTSSFDALLRRQARCLLGRAHDLGARA